MPPGKKNQPAKENAIKPATDFDTSLVGKNKPEINNKKFDIKKLTPTKNDNKGQVDNTNDLLTTDPAIS